MEMPWEEYDPEMGGTEGSGPKGLLSPEKKTPSFHFMMHPEWPGSGILYSVHVGEGGGTRNGKDTPQEAGEAENRLE